MKMKIKCKVCGCEFEATKEIHYISREEGRVGLSATFGNHEEVKLYDTFDCPVCGCQIVVQKRNRVFVEESFEKGEAKENSE